MDIRIVSDQKLCGIAYACAARDSLVIESKFPHKLNFKKEEIAHG
mgnify:CR=1 FL=1